MTDVSPFCRAGLPLGATTPGDCSEPVISAAEAEALGISRRWCSEHGRVLSDARREVMAGRRQPKVVKRPPADVKVTHVEPERPPAPKVEKLPKAVRAVRLARAVQAAGHLDKTAAAEAAGLDSVGGSLPRVAAWAAVHGWIVVRRGPVGGYDAGPTPVPADDA